MATDRELIDAAIEAGRTKKIPEGERAIPLPEPHKATFKVRPEPIHSPVIKERCRHLDEIDNDTVLGEDDEGHAD